MRPILPAIAIFAFSVSWACAGGISQRSDQDNLYYFSGRMYGPQEYCEWGGGIPKRYVEICKRSKPQSRQAQMARVDELQKWVRIKAANGAEYAIDIGNVGHPENGIVSAIMCQVDVDHHHCVGGIAHEMYLRTLWFDCRGHYADVTHPAVALPGWQVAPPYSVIGRASDMVCQKTKSLSNEHKPQ